MAAPELVVADAPFKVYPGGVIALRATDWMGAARGTLTSEIDSRAITGECVRDTQTVATSIATNPSGAFDEALDTLVIPFASLPVELTLQYLPMFSILIEGDWDVTNLDTSRNLSDQHQFKSACGMGWYGDSTFATTETAPIYVEYKPRLRPHFVITGGGFRIGNVGGTETLRVRAYARSGTTVEWLLDQVFLVPIVSSSDATEHNGWKRRDFRLVGGGHNTVGTVTFADGADGGDINGQFTWHPEPQELHELASGEIEREGGGDYQKSPDSEYMIRVVPDDGYETYNTATLDEAPLVAYSFHGPAYRPADVWTTDPFTRVVAGGWGVTPEAFQWTPTNTGGGAPSVDGTRGIHHMGGVIGGGASCRTSLFQNVSTTVSARIAAPDLIFSGIFNVNEFAGTSFIGGSTQAEVQIRLSSENVNRGPSYFILFDIVAQEWALWRSATEAETSIVRTKKSADFDVSSWFAFESDVGFKIEVRRYVVRAKVWDATGAEPAGWDYEDFRDLSNGSLAPTFYAYPYSTAPDPLAISVSIERMFPVTFTRTDDATTQWRTYWDNIVVEYEPEGSPDSMWATIEQPEGTQRGQIEVPYGAWQMVHWGTRDWTDDSTFFSFPALEFSGKVWNEAGVAELQRAEALLYYFRRSSFTLVSMNWREADRSGVATRVLVGGSGR